MGEYGLVLKNVDLKNYNTYKTGGKTKYLIKVNNVDCLRELINYLKENKIKYIVLGKGSNVILPDEDFDGVIILLDNINKVEFNNDEVYVEGGILLSQFISCLVENDLGGLENLYGIPGTVGGAIYGNVGCYGSTISDNLISVDYLEDGVIKSISKEDCNFNYRDSLFKHNKNKIIVGAKFKLFKSDKNIMKEKIKENLLRRKNSQPIEYPNAGSVFRNPDCNSAGKLIEDIGLKNYNVNGAYVSEKHANFIINKGNATSEDIKELIKIIKTKIKNQYGIELILEQEIVKY